MRSKTLPISASVITLNEEGNIEECLRSLDFCEEKIVVDSGSTDRTKEIAEKMGARVFVNPFEGYRQQKQWALDRCTEGWVLCLDADERVTEELKGFLEKIDLKTTDVDGFEIRRRYIFMGRTMRHSGLYPDYKLRLVKRGKAKWGGVNPHDKLIVEGKTKKIPYDINHYPWKNCWDYLNTQLKYSRIMAGEKFRAGERSSFSDLTLRPIHNFLYRYFIRLGFLDGFPGFVVCAGGAASSLAKYIFIRERLINPNQKNETR